MLKPLVLTAALALTTFGLADNALAAPRRAPRAVRAHRVADALHLTEPQRQEIRRIREASRAQMQALHGRMRDLATEFVRLRDAADPRADEVKQQIRDTREEISIRRLAVRGEIERVLTPEQRERFRKMRQRRMQRAGRR